MKSRNRRAFLVTGTLLLPILILVVSVIATGAQPQNDVNLLYVDDDACPGTGVGTMADPYCSLQYAVSAAPDSGVIYVAEGIYTGTSTIQAQDNYSYTQVVIIDRKSIKIAGGYDAGNWLAGPDPLTHPTVIDAQGYGRAVTVLGTGSQQVTLAGMTVTGGDYTDLGNPGGLGNQACLGTGYDCGGGIRAKNLQLMLEGLLVVNNVAGRNPGKASQGGGLDGQLLKSGSRIVNSQFISNTASGERGYGGGVWVNNSELTIQDSIIAENTTTRAGGGLYLSYSEPVVISGTTFSENRVPNRGGALEANLRYCDELRTSLVIENSYFMGNEAYSAPAFFVFQPSAPGYCSAVMRNLVLAENSTSDLQSNESLIGFGNGADPFEIELNHITAADNLADVFLELNTDNATSVMTATVDNTLVVSMSVGLNADESDGELTVNLNSILFYQVDDTYLASGTPSINLVNQVFGDPKLDETYHLNSGSAAIDAGAVTDLPYDIDGDPRLDGRPDIGADEVSNLIFLPVIIK